MFKKLSLALAAMLVTGAVLLISGSAFAQGTLSLGGAVRLNSTATSTSTCNNKACLLTTPSLTNVSGSEYAITITNSEAASGDAAICAVVGGTNTAGQPLCQAIPGSGSVAVTIANSGATTLNGTLTFLLWVLKP
jgi:hypothetical protein